MEVIGRAITDNDQGVASTSEDDRNFIFLNDNLATAPQRRLERTGSMHDLSSAIQTTEKAIAFNPNDVSQLNNLGNALGRLFERTGSIEDLDRWVTTIEQAVASLPDDHPNRTMYLDDLVNALQSRFERTGLVEDLDRVIMINELAVASTMDDHPDHTLYLCNLAIALNRRFKWTGSQGDLNRSIALIEQAVVLTPDGHPDRAMCLTDWGIILQSRFEQTGDKEDLDRAIATSEQAVASTFDNDLDRAGCLDSLGNALQSRFERTGSMEDLNRAIMAFEQAVVSIPDHHPSHIAQLTNLANALQSRFERTGSIEDLDRAITMMEREVTFTPDDHSGYAELLHSLGSALWDRFERTGSVEDIDRAITINEQAVAFTPDDGPDRVRYLSSLGIALQSRFERTGSRDDLDRAITTKEQAISSTPDDHPDHPMYLSSLGNSLRSRFNRTGSMEDLDRAIVMNSQAVESTPDEDPNRARRLINLGNALQIRFGRTGSMEDINLAITTLEQAVASTPDDHPNRMGRLNNLGVALQKRSERTGSMEDLDRAIVMNGQAVAFTPEDHPALSSRLNNLGDVLQRRFVQTGAMEDLNRAITTLEQAVAFTPENHPNRVGRLNNLGIALHKRYEQTGSMEDLDRAIVTKEQAVASTPDDHPDRASMLNNLGTTLQSRFERSGSMEDLDRAIATKELAVMTPTAPPSIRVLAADSASQLLVDRDSNSWNRAKAILRIAVDLLPTTSPRTLNQLDRQYNISQFAGITSRAVSVSLQCGETPYRALQLSELGNGVLATLHIQMRSDVLLLKESHPDLAHPFYDLRDQLDPPSNFMHSTELSTRADAENRRTLSNKFDKLLGKIRQLEGFEHFLLAPSESELKRLAAFGPIVVFNVSKIRSDAFIVKVDDIRFVPLPLLTNTHLKAYTKRFLIAVHTLRYRSYAYARQEIQTILEWLWDAAVSPVLDELKFTQVPSSNSVWPRVWWVGSGLLNILPIHAAGYHQIGSPRNVINRVISSYTPTIKALAYARERYLRVASLKSQKALLVGMPETPGLNNGDLPSVATEINNLNRFLSSHIQTTVIQMPTKENVLSVLRDHQIIHFACHGYSSPRNPSQSRLLLNDWQISPLTVSDLTALNIPMSQFAFLSACHSASSRDFRLLSESINLSSAIQLAGYPSVVGTLWNVRDNHSAEIAKDVYAQILVENKLDTKCSAEALHHAVRSLRDRTRTVPGFKKKTQDDPFVWAPYIHLGV